MLLEYLDTNQNGSVDLNEFLRSVRGEPNAVRQEIIKRAFDKFDIYNEGLISSTELEQVFSCPSHPKVEKGEMTVNDVFVLFMSSFSDLSGTGRVSWT